jgi:hypothetical protein
VAASAQSELGRFEAVGVEQWAEIHRLQFVKGVSQREIRRWAAGAKLTTAPTMRSSTR